MLFNSVLFLGFFAAVYLLYVVLQRRLTLQNLMLLGASYAFYAAWDYRFLALIIGSTVVDFTVARLIHASESQRKRKALLMVSLTYDLGVLAFFKYADFGIQSFAALMESLGFEAHVSTLRIILPVGISFYTFQAISYTVDVYRRDKEPVKKLRDFALYVAFFPQLVAGPIERATHLLPQVERARRIRMDDIRVGIAWICLGYFKKVVIADSVAPMVDSAFDNPNEVTGLVAFLALVGFAVQIYGDFSGYSLIARGLARLMGFDIMQNFKRPYLARNPREFWRRWHLSLSFWLRDYLYKPLGGNRKGRVRTEVNLMITMFLGGLWHGAAWNFVIWGVYHGALLVACNLLGMKGKPPKRSLPIVVLQISVTFIFTLIGWLLFRVSDMGQAWDIFVNILTNFVWSDEAWSYLVPTLAALGALQAYHIWQEAADDELVIMRAPRVVRWAILLFCVLCIVGVGFRPAPFVYFQF